MTKSAVSDTRRLATAVDRLDAVSATDRQNAAKHVFDVCVFHVARVRQSHPVPPPPPPPPPHPSTSQSSDTPQNTHTKVRGHGRLSPDQIASTTTPTPVTPHFVFDILYPHIYRIARRLDRAMRYAESSPHPADAAALICAVDAQGALAAMFAVAQNAGCPSTQLDTLAMPLRKRSAPALLRTLFSPDMRVANAAKKALRQIITIASCQNSPWMSTIRSALSLRTAAKINRTVQLRNLLTRLAEILHLVIKQAAIAKVMQANQAIQAGVNGGMQIQQHHPGVNDPLTNQQQIMQQQQLQMQIQQQQQLQQQQQQQQQQQHLYMNNYQGMNSINSSAALRKKTSRTSLSSMVIGRQRHSLSAERRAAERYAEGVQSNASSERSSIRDFFRRKVNKPFLRGGTTTVRPSLDSDAGSDRTTTKRRFNNTHSYHSQQQHAYKKPDISTFSPYRSATTPNIETSINAEDWHSVASGGVLSTGGGSYPGSVFSSITESATGTFLSPPYPHQNQHNQHHQNSRQNQQQQHNNTIKRDAATAMYIFERLLAKRTNPDLQDRIQVLKVLTDITTNTFSGKYATINKIANADEYAESMAIVFNRHGLKIYSVILDILFRPVKEADANRIGIFSFHETGMVTAGGGSIPATNMSPQDINHHGGMAGNTSGNEDNHGGIMVTPNKRKIVLTEFPQSAICLPNMECTSEAALISNSLLTLFMTHIPSMCTQRMALITGTINSAFLYCSEALITNNNGKSFINSSNSKHKPYHQHKSNTNNNNNNNSNNNNNNINNNHNGKCCKWDLEKLKRAAESLSVLVKAIPTSVDMALELIIREPVTLRLVIETCIRSVSATGRLMAQNAARYSAPKVSDDGTLDSLRSWQKLIKILPGAAAWSGTPSYSSSILFLAQVARRAALIEAIKDFKKNKRKYSSSTVNKEADKSSNASKTNKSSEDNEEVTGTKNDVLDTTEDNSVIKVIETEDETAQHVLSEGTQKSDRLSDRVYTSIINNSINQSHRFNVDSDTNNTNVTTSSKDGLFDDDDSHGMEIEEENILTKELHQCVIDMINIPGTSPGDIFFELYRTVVYLYANDLKKQAKAKVSHNHPINTEVTTAKRNTSGASEGKDRKQVPEVVTRANEGNARAAGGMKRNGTAGIHGGRTQSDEDAKGVLVENIAVDGQLPSRALRRAVMASELDLGEYFDEGLVNSTACNTNNNNNVQQAQAQPPSLQHLGHDNEEYRESVPLGAHTFEEFAHALAIIIGTLSKPVITDNFENPHEAASMIARDVQRSGSLYLKKVHRRAKMIVRKNAAAHEMDWRVVKYEERIKRLEEQVASLKSLVQSNMVDDQHSAAAKVMHMSLSRRGSIGRLLNMCSGHGNGGEKVRTPGVHNNKDSNDLGMCGPAGCFCV